MVFSITYYIAKERSRYSLPLCSPCVSDQTHPLTLQCESLYHPFYVIFWIECLFTQVSSIYFILT